MSLPMVSPCTLNDDEDECSACGWKCSCYECTGQSGNRWAECQCSCRFWVVVCFVILTGFFVVFYVATVFRKKLLYAMASAAVAISGVLSALAAGTDQCRWPAFFSISLVFAFPCIYSCCWQCQQQREEQRRRENGECDGEHETGSLPGKQMDAVVMVFPGGEVQLGVLEDQKPENAQKDSACGGELDVEHGAAGNAGRGGADQARVDALRSPVDT